MNTSTNPFRSHEKKEKYLAHYEKRLSEWAKPYEEFSVNTSFGKTQVRVNGKKGLPPLVLLPGAGSCSLQWVHNISTLSLHYRTYAIDGLINLGCLGKSEPTKPIINAKDAVVWMNELFDHLQFNGLPILVGASYGGWLAAQYAVAHPNRLKKLVLIAPAGVVMPFSFSYMIRAIVLNVLPAKVVYRCFFKWSFRHLWHHNKTLWHAVVDDFSLSVACFNRVNPKELPIIKPLNDEQLKALTLISTHFIIGEHDVLYCARAAIEKLNKVAPQINTEIISNAGHDLLLVETERINTKIIDCL